MKISEVSNITGLTKKAIDYYQQKEIINPKIDESGHRDFNESDIELLKQVGIFRVLGLTVSDIKVILDSKFPREDLRKCVIKKQLENELSKKQTQLLEQLSNGESTEKVNREISELNKKKTVKEKLLEAFPGFYGRSLVNHFSQFLEEPIETEEQKQAYKVIIRFLDEINLPEIPDDIMNQFEEAMDFWTDEKLMEFEGERKQNLENIEKFLEDYSEIIEKHQAFKESPEYENSSYGQLMKLMRSFGETSGYNDIFIPAMRRLSTTYEMYYQNLMKANDEFIKKFPNFK